MIVNGPINKKMILTIKTLNCCVKFPLCSPESYGYLVHHNTDCKLWNSFYFYLQRPGLQEGVLERILQFKFRASELYYCEAAPFHCNQKSTLVWVYRSSTYCYTNWSFKHLSSLGSDKISSHFTGLLGGKQDAVIRILVEPCLLPGDSNSSHKVLKRCLLVLWWNTMTKSNLGREGFILF